MSEPMPVLALNYAQGGATAGPGRKLRLLVPISWAACLIATALIWTVDVETVMGSGPVIATLGLAMLIAGVRSGSTWHVILGAAHCAICLLFFMFAWWVNWGPAEATTPFGIMGAAYTLLSGVASGWLILRSRAGR